MVGGAFLTCSESSDLDSKLFTIACEVKHSRSDYQPSSSDLYIEIEGQIYYPRLESNKWVWVFNLEDVDSKSIHIKSSIPGQEVKSQSLKTKGKDKDKHPDKDHKEKISMIKKTNKVSAKTTIILKPVRTRKLGGL